MITSIYIDIIYNNMWIDMIKLINKIMEN